jgi:hypothetical protein
MSSSKIPAYVSSPSTVESVPSINLFRGARTGNLERLSKTPRENMYWTTHYKNSGSIISPRYKNFFDKMKEDIMETYESILGGCFAPFLLEIDKKDSGNFIIRPEEDDVDLNEMYQEFDDCLNSFNNRMTVVRVRIRGAGSTHATLLLFNKIHRTAEYYDPNGYKAIEKAPGVLNGISEFLNSFPSALFYHFVPIRENNLKFGLQALSNRFADYSDYIDRGLCAKWFFYILQLRLERIEETPAEFKRKIGRRIDKLRKEGKTSMEHYLSNYILDHMMQTFSGTPVIRSRPLSLSPASSVSSSRFGGPLSAFSEPNPNVFKLIRPAPNRKTPVYAEEYFKEISPSKGFYQSQNSAFERIPARIVRPRPDRRRKRPSAASPARSPKRARR